MTPQDKIRSARRLLEEARDGLKQHLADDLTRGRGAAVRDLHQIERMLGDTRFFSQAGQDRIVDRLLNGKAGGTFADIGGYDGVTGSNTLFFELFRGWNGVLVEPAPNQFRKAQAMRSCACLPYAVAGEVGELDFMEVTGGYTQMSGFIKTYEPGLLSRVRGDVRHKETLHRLQTKPLGDVLTEAGLTEIDYLSLDVEGSEFDILEAFDFASFDVAIWSVENNSGTADLPALMADRGYDLVEFAGVDDIFCKRRT